MRRKKDNNVERDLGLKLLKMLLLRLYSMMVTNPLKWWEVLIVTVMGLFFGLMGGAILSSYLKASIIIRLG